MKTVDEYNEVRRLRFVEGLSARRIAKRTGFHRKTVKKILALGGPPGYQRTSEPRRPVLGAIIAIIDEILESDQAAPPKQRHTAQRIYDRLKTEHGYRGDPTQVRQYVSQARALRQEAYVPLEFGPGEAQVDWGEAQVIEEGSGLHAGPFGGFGDAATRTV